LVDEGTSALNQELSLEIHRNFKKLPKTIIEVAHKLTTEELSYFDHIIHLDQKT